MKPTRILLVFILALCINSCGVSKKKSKSPGSSKPTVSKPEASSNLLEKYSQKLGATVTNEALYKTIDGWIGVPYRYGGRSKSGIDCSNFTCEILREVFRYPSNFYFPSSKLAEQGNKISLSEAREGDLVFFAINQSSKISHVGIYLTNQRFIHASTSQGVMISSLQEEYYKKRFAYVRRLKN